MAKVASEDGAVEGKLVVLDVAAVTSVATDDGEALMSVAAVISEAVAPSANEGSGAGTMPVGSEAVVASLAELHVPEVTMAADGSLPVVKGLDVILALDSNVEAPTPAEESAAPVTGVEIVG